MVGQIEAELNKWTSTLDEYAMCQPVNFQVTEVDGKVEIDPMITHKLTLDEINHGFDLMHEGKSIRAVVEF